MEDVAVVVDAFAISLLASLTAACGNRQRGAIDGNTPAVDSGALVDSTVGRTDASARGEADATLDAPHDVRGDAIREAPDGAEASACYRPAPTSASVLQFHKNPTRDGVYVDPGLTPQAIKGMQRRSTAPLTGQVYAQPLYVADAATRRELFVAATEANHVTVFDGCGKTVWDKAYGTPAAYADLPCGNVYPTLGITGTPIVDQPARTIYFDAMTQTSSGTAGLRHLVHAVSLDDGAERPGWPVDVNAGVAGFDSSHQNQRGALTLLGGTLYVPYGGHFGDCGQYFGWIVGVPVAGPRSARAWRTIGGNPWDAGAPLSGGGFWAVGGLPTDGTSLFAVSGNTMDPTDASRFLAPPAWVGGESVFRLAPGPSFSGAPADFFRPSDWQTLDDGDMDLGSTNAVLFDIGRSHYVLVVGKSGVVYVLDRDDLGAGPVVSQRASVSTDIIGAPIVFTTTAGTYAVLPEYSVTPNAILLLKGDPPALAPDPNNLPSPGPGGLIATTTDGASNFHVWVAGERLTSFDGSGNQAAAVSLTDRVHYMAPPIAANGRVVVATCGSCYGPPGQPGSLTQTPPGNGQLVFVY
jgi:hypothetical protein